MGAMERLAFGTIWRVSTSAVGAMVEMGERAVIPAEKGRGREVAEREAQAGPAILPAPTVFPAPMG